MINEVENLLSSIFQSGGTIKVQDGQLLVGPVSLAQRFSDQIKRLKPEILLALGHCPECAGKLESEIRQIDYAEENATTGRTGKHVYCIAPRHYDKWSF